MVAICALASFDAARPYDALFAPHGILESMSRPKDAAPIRKAKFYRLRRYNEPCDFEI